jgi:hypothetical protein
LRSHARAKLVFDVELEMAFQFGGELTFPAGLAEELGKSDE